VYQGWSTKEQKVTEERAYCWSILCALRLFAVGVMLKLDAAITVVLVIFCTLFLTVSVAC
jgi:hypothetical protein